MGFFCSTDALIEPLGVYLQLFTDYWEREVVGHTFVMAGDWDLQSASLYQTFRSGLNGSPAAAVSHVGFTSVALSGHAVGPQCLWSIHKQPWPPYSDQPLWPAEREQSETPVRASGRHQAFRDFTFDFMAVVFKVGALAAWGESRADQGYLHVFILPFCFCLSRANTYKT